MQSICEEIWVYLTKSQPQFSIYKGIASCVKDLDSFSELTMTSSMTFWKNIQSKLLQVDYTVLSDDDKITWDIVEYNLNIVFTGLQYETYLMPVNYWEHPLFYFFTFTQPQLPFKTVKDYNTYMEILKKLPKQLEEVKDVLKIGLQKKIVQHQSSLGTPLFRRLSELTDCEIVDNEFYKPFLQSDHLIDREKWKEIQAHGEDVIKMDVVQSIKSFKDFMKKEYVPYLRTELSINSLPTPQGIPTRFEALMKFYCDVDHSPAEFHQIGVSEVNKLKQRISQIMEKFNFKGSIREFTDYVNAKEEHKFKSEDDVLSFCEEYYKTVILPKIKCLFKRQAHVPLLFKNMSGKPPAKAIYNAAPHNGSQPATLWVRGSDYTNLRKYEIPTLMLHETEPGHHMQACYASQNESLPTFRTVKDDRKYFQAPGRFPLNSAYTEGWGLYSEELGEELGLYSDVYSLFGYLSSNLGRSARVVTETGIHALGWTRDQAREYMVENTAMTENGIEGELDRYITWPGQASCYIIGYLEIIRLRELAKEQLGEAFDIAEFHDVCLWCGQVPLKILNKIVQKYIEKTLSV